jgi:hypothetical protein
MIKIFIYPAILAAAVFFSYSVKQHPITKFLIDGRPKIITYFHTTFMFTHIEIEVIEPEIRKDCAAFQSINIYIFSETYHVHHTISWRYIKFIET